MHNICHELTYTFSSLPLSRHPLITSFRTARNLSICLLQPWHYCRSFNHHWKNSGWR